MSGSTGGTGTMRVLCLEDSPEDAELVRATLAGVFQLEMKVASDRSSFEELLAGGPYDVILADYALPGFDAHGALELAKVACPTTPFICVSGKIGEETTVELLKEGADDCVLKDRLARLPFAVQRAIDERTREAALRLSEEKYGIAFHASPDSITITRLCDGKLVEVNEGYERMFGYTRAESIGKTTVELSVYADPGTRDSLVTRLRETGEVKDFDANVRRKDGTSVAVIVSAKVLDFQGEECFLAVAHDITERKRAERELRESETALREAQRIGQIGSYDWDARTDVITWSDEYYRIYGLDPSQAPPGYEEHLRAYSPESAARLDAAVKAVTQTGEPYFLDLEEVRSNGTRAWITARGEAKRDKEGTIIGVHGTVQDVSERKRVEQEQSRAEGFFRDTFEHAYVGIAHVASADGTWLRVNQRLCDLLGYTREELMQTTFAAVTHPDDVEQNMTHLRRMLAGDEDTYGAEKRYLRKDGSIVWVHTNVASIRKEDGTPDYYITVLTDITERKRAEEALASSERFSQRVLETSPNVIYIYDLVENRSVYTNREISGMLGYTPEEILAFGADVFENIMHPDDAALIAEHHARLAGLAPDDDRVLEIDYRTKRADGEWRWLHSRDIPFARDDSGAVTQILGSTEDITDRRVAAERLRESEDRYRLLFENASDAVYVHEISAGGPGRFTDANRCASEMLGYSREEFLTMDVGAIDVPEMAAKVPAVMAELAAAGSVQFETEHLSKNGQRIPVEINVRVLDVQGVPTVLSNARDITERKEAEEARDIRVRITDIFGTDPEEEMYREVLEVVLEVMHSPLGLFGYLDENGDWVVPSMTREVWDQCQVPDKSIRFPRDTWGDSSWVRALREKRTIHFNEPSPNIPEGHISIQRQISMPILFRGEAIGLFQVANKETDYTEADLRTLADIAGYVAPLLDARLRRERSQEELAENAERLARQAERIERALISVIDIAGNIGEMRDPYTAGHQRRVAELAEKIAQDLGMSDLEVADIRVAGLLHDMGKAGVPTEILGKPGAISPTEFELIKGHAEAGYQLAISANMQEPIPELIYEHHERCDGSGYPRGLLGDQTLPGAKVLAVADVVEAMMSHRPYRPALGVEAAIAEIERGAGSRYDADVSRACVALFRDGRFEFSV